MPSPDPFEERTARTAELVSQLHAIVSELEALHPGRKLTPDSHLVGALPCHLPFYTRSFTAAS